MCLTDLEIPKPYFGVQKGEREDVVDERFSSPSLWRHAKYLSLCFSFFQNTPNKLRKKKKKLHDETMKATHMCKQLFRQSSPLGRLKRRVEAQDPTTALETVPGHFELVHRVHVLHVQLDARPIRCLGRPEVQVLVPARLKVQRIVARV